MPTILTYSRTRTLVEALADVQLPLDDGEFIECMLANIDEGWGFAGRHRERIALLAIKYLPDTHHEDFAL